MQGRIRNVLTAALATLLLVLAGCEDPGGIGGGLLDEQAGLQTTTTPPASLEQLTTSGFSGRLRFMAIGTYNDPLFGEFESIGILKPSIDTTRIGSSISEEDQFQLQVAFSPIVYGDTLSSARFEIYRLAEVWRGNELRFGDSVQIDRSELVGEFTVTGTERVLVDLSESWISEYNEYLSNSDDNRNTVYRDEFPGLAIVPADGSSKVLSARVQSATGEQENSETLVRFVLTPPEEENGDGDEGDEENGEEEEEDPRIFHPLADWAVSGARSAPDQTDPESFYLQNTLDDLLKVGVGLTRENLESRNLAGVQLVFYQNSGLLESTLPVGHVRPQVSQLLLHRVPSDRIGEWIYGQPADFVAVRHSETNSFRFNITEHVNRVLFDSPPPGAYYLTAQTVNGLIYSTVLFNEEAPAELRPKIVITSINSDSTDP